MPFIAVEVHSSRGQEDEAKGAILTASYNRALNALGFRMGGLDYILSCFFYARKDAIANAHLVWSKVSDDRELDDDHSKIPVSQFAARA